MNRALPLRRLLLIVVVAALSAAAVLAVSCAPSVRIDGSSPVLQNVELASSSDMTESSQRVSIKLTFDRPVTASSGWLDDVDFTLNGSAVDAKSIKSDAESEGNSITLVLEPADAKSTSKSFALYAAQFSLSAKRSDGALPSVAAADGGSTAVLNDTLWGTLPSGLSIEMLQQTIGSASANQPASATFRVTSPAKARVITWFSVDGGQTLLLKHNHQFASQDAPGAASDLASLIEKSGTGLNARAVGATVTVTALSVADGQAIDPCVVEGLGIAGGEYEG